MDPACHDTCCVEGRESAGYGLQQAYIGTGTGGASLAHTPADVDTRRPSSTPFMLSRRLHVQLRAAKGAGGVTAEPWKWRGGKRVPLTPQTAEARPNTHAKAPTRPTPAPMEPAAAPERPGVRGRGSPAAPRQQPRPPEQQQQHPAPPPPPQHERQLASASATPVPGVVGRLYVPPFLPAPLPKIPSVEGFFAFTLERQCAYHRKEVLKLPAPWTNDPGGFGEVWYVGGCGGGKGGCGGGEDVACCAAGARALGGAGVPDGSG